MNDKTMYRGGSERRWFDALRGRPEAAAPATPTADPPWMNSATDAPPQSPEGRDEGWLISSWELRRGLSVSEVAPEVFAQVLRSTSRLSAAPSSITAIA